MLRKALELARENGYLGRNIMGKGFDFDIELFSGAGAYICGEGSSLIESMEGKSGRPRIKPPYTKVSGLYHEPTLVHNVETLTTIKSVLFHGADVFAKYGTEESKGTKLISLCGNVNVPGVYEVPFGITIREIIEDIGGGMKDGQDVKFLQLGGASGAIMPKSLIDIPYSYEAFKENGLEIGSGAVLVADNTNRIIDFLDSVQTFFLHESCGKCTPCREGNRQLSNILGRMKEGVATDKDVASVEKIANIMKYASFCGLGKTAPTAVLTAIRYFSDELFSKGDVYERV
jgi:NADH-quinone oxidoreductase subunit F